MFGVVLHEKVVLEVEQEPSDKFCPTVSYGIHVVSVLPEESVTTVSALVRSVATWRPQYQQIDGQRGSAVGLS